MLSFYVDAHFGYRVVLSQMEVGKVRKRVPVLIETEQQIVPCCFSNEYLTSLLQDELCCKCTMCSKPQVVSYLETIANLNFQHFLGASGSDCHLLHFRCGFLSINIS